MKNQKRQRRRQIRGYFSVGVLMVCMALFAGCTQQNTSQSTTKKDGKYHIVCTIFPAYDWVREIVGEQKDRFEITYLLEDGVDLHSYQPTIEDMAKISDCDLFIYVGGESDGWVQDAIGEAKNSNMKTISLLDAIGSSAKEEELVAGMQAEPEEDAEEDEVAYDEHVWLSLKNAQQIVPVIATAIEDMDGESREKYQENCENYQGQLALLDRGYALAVEKSSNGTVLFADRFPFRYLVDDYGIQYYAAFVGCSAETEASFETVIFLAKQSDTLGLKAVLVTENSDKKLADTLIQNTKDKNQQILVMDSMQSTTTADIEKGMTYLSVMGENLEVLQQALQ